MKVKFIKSHPKFAYFAGDVADITDKKHLEMLNGFVVPVKETATKRTSKKVETATKK